MSRIDYNLALIKGVALDVDGVISPSTCQLSDSGHPIRMGNVKDGYAMQLAVKRGLKIAVITGGQSVEIANRMSILGIIDVWQNIPDKLPVLSSWMEANGFRKEEVAYMGDDIPDLRCLRKVGLPCCPYDAAWEARQESLYISPFSGGYGCVRDLIEQILKACNLWLPDSPDNFLW